MKSSIHPCRLSTALLLAILAGASLSGGAESVRPASQESSDLPSYTATGDRVAAADALFDARRAIAKLAVDAAKLGLDEVASDCLGLLEELEASERDRLRCSKSVEKALSKKPRPFKRRTLERLAKQTSAAAEYAAKAAGEAEPERSAELYTLAVRLDASSEAGHLGLGHVRSPDGSWTTDASAQLSKRRSAIAEALQKARRLEPELEIVEPVESLLGACWDGKISAVRHAGLTIESYWPQEQLNSAFRDLLRVLAFSNWLSNGTLEPNHQEGKVLHVPTGKFQEFNRRMSELGRVEGLFNSATFCYVELPDGRGEVYTRYAVAMVGNRSQLVSVLPVLYDASLDGWGWDTYYDTDPPVPFWLVIGHLNFASQALVGVESANFAEHSDSQQTAAARVQREWTLADSGIIGCRSWLRHLVREGRAPSLARCMPDQVGKVVGEIKWKVTATVDFLHDLGTFKTFKERYAQHARAEARGIEQARTTVERAEAALGHSIPIHEEAWRGWLFGEDQAYSVRDRILDAATEDDPAAAVLSSLNELREAAGLEPVELNDELSRGAAQHAAYLERHPSQKTMWPDAHEEYLEREGFSAEGAWAGGHSVIAFDGHETCMQQWYGTFYHRVPLTHPGLKQVGIGVANGTTVLDCTSICDTRSGYEAHTPFDGQRDVPRAFQPELPNPVTERSDQTTLGYPITYQLGNGRDDLEVTMHLYLGDEEVPCYRSTPSRPINPELAPRGCYCLIPRSPLEAGAMYTVRVEGPGSIHRFSFRTGR